MRILRWYRDTLTLDVSISLIHLPTTQTINHVKKRHRDMTKEDMILEAISEIRKGQIEMGKDVAVLKYVSSSLEEMKTDMAVLKDKHNTGNRSERAMVGMSLLALLVSICVAVTSCRGCIDESKNNKRTYPISPNRLR